MLSFDVRSIVSNLYSFFTDVQCGTENGANITQHTHLKCCLILVHNIWPVFKFRSRGSCYVVFEYMKTLENSILKDPWITTRPRKYMASPLRNFYKRRFQER